MNYGTKVFWSSQLMVICLSILAFSIGCASHEKRVQAIYDSFTNQVIQVRHTYYSNQFIVRCEDGSVYELLIDDSAEITYKDCLFDSYKSFYSLPVFHLEK